MRLLIDTHALIWYCEGNLDLSETARAAIEDDSNERFVSHASAWEIAIKLGLGKLRPAVGYEVMFPGVVNANGFKMLPTTTEHFRELVPLPTHHRDPFDRLIIAQAKTEGMTIVTCDAFFRAYGVPLLW